MTDGLARRKVLAARKPTLLLRLSGWLLLRMAERALSALLLNDPPRNTRLLGRRPLTAILPGASPTVHDHPRKFARAAYGGEG